MESAVYARQSVEKKNSLSIEGQIDLCQKAAGHPLRIYQDRGFSGKNTQRPDFQRLMKDIRAGRIDRLYVYRLDRFSRSVADFGNLWNTLQEHRVEFVSVSENFDTSMPMGRAMLHIIMVFAQLERETTAERVKDNYYKRASLGAWPGGPAPFGFCLARIPDADGQPRPSLVIEPERAKIVERIFQLYASEAESLGSVARKLNAEGVKGPRRDTWDNVSLSRILHCPAYVRADEQIRLHYQGLGANVTSPADAFDGRHGLLLVGRRDRAQRKYTDVHGHTVSVMNSEGFIEPELWLHCQNRLSRNRRLGNTGRGTHTWLTGLMKCAECGYSLKVAATGSRRFLNCSGRYNLAKCSADIRADLSGLEAAVAAQIQILLDESPDMPVQRKPDDDLASRLEQLDRKADRIIGAFSESSEMTASYLNRAVLRIEEERTALLAEMKRRNDRIEPQEKLEFSSLSFEGKKTVAAQFIRRIDVSGENAEIFWNA